MARTAIWVLVLSLGFSATVHAGSPWTVFKHDGKRTGRTNTLGPQTNSLKWVTLLENLGIQAQLAVAADGTIYSGSVHGNFYAFRSGRLDQMATPARQASDHRGRRASA